MILPIFHKPCNFCKYLAEETRQKKLEQFADKLSSLTPKEQETIDKLTRSLANDLIRDTIINMKLN